MHVIHGTWIPDDDQEFAQNGAFYLWVETDTPARASKRRVDDSVHPRHLAGAALSTFLGEKLGIRDNYAGAVSRSFSDRYFLLPSAGGMPLPSFELSHYVDQDIPESFDLTPWKACCYRLPYVIATLNNIHFIALHAADEFQLGTDLLFWHQFTRVLKQIVVKDQYIPALKYRDLAPAPPARAKRSKDAKPFEIHPSWEIVSASYEADIRRYAAAMPLVCTAGSATPRGPELLAPEPLLHHFSECLLHEIVTGTPLTAKLDQQIAGTLLYDCVYPYRPSRALAPDVALDEYRQWAAWRERLTRAQTSAGFTLCFRLEEPLHGEPFDMTQDAPAEATSPDRDDWQVHFLVAAKDDPSLKLSLADYWECDAKARTKLARAFGPDFERDLLLALGHAARIYSKVWDGLETAQPAGFRLTLDEAYTFLRESAWILEDAGYTVIVPSWWTPQGRRRAKLRLKTSASASGRSKAGSSASNGYFNLDSIVAYQYQLSIGGEIVGEEEWRQLVAAKSPLVRFRGQWMELDREKMQQLLEFWKAHQEGELQLTVQDLLKTGAEAGDDLEWDHDQTLREMLAQLQDKSAFAPIADPPNLHGTLREYQKRGVAWLGYLESVGLNPCLADDMGLGKTLEVIAHLVREKNASENQDADLAPTLVIAPTSVLGNWRKEIERFAPQLRVLVHQGSGRIKQEPAFGDACRSCDVVVTSFALARLDEKLFCGVQWRRVVVDEAQNIKNPSAAQTRAIGRLPARHRLALTGTPVENRLLDLWSIFNFLNPGYLGKEAQFRKSFELPIQKNNDLTRSTALKRLVEPFILRRVKTDQRIIADLPEKIEQTMYCNLTPEQASLYEAVVKDVSEQLEAAEGIQRRGLILATLMKLKQVCNHPAQLLQDGSAFTSERSHKLQRLSEMVEEAIASEESLLIFTQFTEIGGALEDYLARNLGCTTYYLHGGTSTAKRERMITAFQDPESEPAVFILSLRAGGVGLNLTKANHVFHFDRWWNPAVEDQATDRAFRIGQRKNVFVHKFVAIGTVEEKIAQMIEDKKRVSAAIVGADESWLTELDNETFKDLIALQRSAVIE